MTRINDNWLVFGHKGLEYFMHDVIRPFLDQHCSCKCSCLVSISSHLVDGLPHRAKEFGKAHLASQIGPWSKYLIVWLLRSNLKVTF